MNGVKIITEGDACWPDLIEHFANDNVIHLSNGNLIEIAMLKQGTVKGKPSLTIRLNLPDGKVVLVETTLDLFLTAARTFEAASLYQNENG
ncbi:hypothetical protein CAL7716_085050 [Calothrix sp. PCC 7716]|nr:hypothetical protein CAL7716_085050 [Calothrix sp. PCC 7716]